MKTCSKCNLELPFEQFSKDRSKKDGLRGECKVCKSEMKKKYYRENKEVISKKNNKYYQENKDKLSEQMKKYREENKEYYIEYIKKYREENKEKISEQVKKYYEENKENIKEQTKKYKEEHKDKISEYMKKYQNENKENLIEKHKKYRQEHKEERNEYDRNRRKVDKGYKILHNLRSRLRNALKGTNKSASTIELVGCTIEFLKDYLENTKVEGKDYSDAHVDHIRPCASFDLTDPEQQRECFHYTNLQYLPAKENISKGARLEYNI